jgi:hypothetical protein
MRMCLASRSTSVVSTSLTHLEGFDMFTPIRPVRLVVSSVLLPSALLAGAVAGISTAAAREPATAPPAPVVTSPYAEPIHALGGIPLAVYLARHEASRLRASF